MRIVSKQSASPETPTARSRRVVVAEDETLIRLDIVETLTEAGYEVVAEAVAAAEARLGDTGRVLLRPSGTEPLVRVMVEAATQEEADSVAASLADVVKESLAL